jgi:hypothetical protein
VELKVLSTLDMRFGLTLGIVGALGVLFFGRPTLLWLPIRLLRRIPLPPRTLVAIYSLIPPIHANAQQLRYSLEAKKGYLHSLAQQHYKVQVKRSKDVTPFNLVPQASDGDAERFAAKESSGVQGNVPKRDTTDWSHI